MIQKNEYPILEYDPDSPEILKAGGRLKDLKLPEKCVYAFLGDTVYEFAEQYGAVQCGTIFSITREFPIWTLEYKGEEIALFAAPVGSAEASMNLDCMIARGAGKIVCAGSCGVLTDQPENAFLIPVRALRDEGASYQYLPPSRFVDLDPRMIRKIKEVLDQNGIPWSECVTWTTDGFFRETKDMVAYRKEEGCTVVEMECAGLAACAQKRGVQFGQLLFTADSLAGEDGHEERGWGIGSRMTALKLLFEIARSL